MTLLAKLSLACTMAIGARHLISWRKEAAIAIQEAPAGVSPSPVLKATPRISVLIVAYLAGEDPAAVVDNFRRIDYPDKELLLGVGGAHGVDDYRHLESADVILIEHPGGLKNIVLRRAFERATGEVIVFTDPDSRYVGDAFRRLVAPIVNGEEQATCGSTIPLPEQDESWVTEIYRTRYREGSAAGLSKRYVAWHTGANSAVLREVLAQIDAFDQGVLSEDNWRAQRLLQQGYRILRVRDAVVETRVPRTVAKYIRQQSRWTRAWYVDSPRLGHYDDTLRGVRAAAQGAAVLSLTALLPFSSRARWLFMPLLVHFYFNRWRRIFLATRQGAFRLRPAHLLVPFLECYIDFIIGVRAFVEAIVPRWRRRW